MLTAVVGVYTGALRAARFGVLLSVVVVLQAGAGLAVPTVRRMSEDVTSQFNGKLCAMLFIRL